MHDFLLMLHTYLRWVLLLVAVLACFHYVQGYFTGQPFTGVSNKLGVWYIALIHTQILLGLGLYLFFILQTELPAGWIKVAALRFRVLEHPTLMLLAGVIAQIGRSLSKGASTAKQKLGKGALLYPISLLLLLLGIPWRG